MTSPTMFVSGFGQFHSNEPTAKTRRAYEQISLDGIRALVDNPQTTSKETAQWLIPSTLPARSFKEQEEAGEYGLLWADLDSNPQPLSVVFDVLLEILTGCDFELYTSRSATADRQKARILIPLATLLCPAEWNNCQQILNDKLLTAGITPDRASERAAQLCYLPNRGEYYDARHQRIGKQFDPLTAWSDDIQAKHNEIQRKAAELEASRKAAAERREALKATDAPDTIGAFNRCYSVQEILLRAGYAQRGDSFRHPQSESGSYSASVKDGRVHSLSSSDPLFTDGQGAHDAFSSFAVLFAGSDTGEALKLAGDQWLAIGGESWNKVQQREFMQRKAADTAGDCIVTTDTVRRLLEPAQDAPQRFQLLTPAELAALPPVRWLVRGVLPQEGIAAVYGPPGSGKSFLTLDLLAHVADGRDWFGCRVNAAPVVYLGLEGEAGIAQRVQAWQSNNGPLPQAFRAILQSLDIRKAGDRAELVQAVEQAGMAGGLLVLDTLNRAAPGADENSSAEMGEIIQAAKALQAELGGLVLMVHHSGKDSSRGLRGHSSLLAALDASLEVTRDTDRREWKIGKAKDGEDGKAHPFRLDVVELGTDEDGEKITSCVCLPDEAPADTVRRAKVPSGGNQKIVWDALGELFLAEGKATLGRKPDDAPEGVPFGRPCLRLEDALHKVRERLTVESGRKTERARNALNGLINRGLIACLEGWIWCK